MLLLELAILLAGPLVLLALTALLLVTTLALQLALLAFELALLALLLLALLLEPRPLVGLPTLLVGRVEPALGPARLDDRHVVQGLLRRHLHRQLDGIGQHVVLHVREVVAHAGIGCIDLLALRVGHQATQQAAVHRSHVVHDIGTKRHIALDVDVKVIEGAHVDLHQVHVGEARALDEHCLVGLALRLDVLDRRVECELVAPARLAHAGAQGVERHETGCVDVRNAVLDVERGGQKTHVSLP